MKNDKTLKMLLRENEELQIRMQEAEETLQAIREGAVDALIVNGPQGDRVFTLTGEDRLYRHLVETMAEAGLTTTLDGHILFCNERFSEMLHLPMEEIVGHPIEEFVQKSCQNDMAELLASAQVRLSKKRMVFQAKKGTPVASRVSANLLRQADSVSVCMVAMDLSELEASEEITRQLQEQKTALEESTAMLHESRRAALNIMEEAVAARQQTEKLNIALQQEVSDRKQAEEAVRYISQRFEILSETASHLLESREPQKVINTLCHKVMEHLDCHVFINYFIDESLHRLHLNTFGGMTDETAQKIEWLDFGQAICGCVAQEGKRIVAENIQESCDVRADLVRSFGIKAYACHPIMVQNHVIGTLSFGTRSRTTFSKNSLALMKTVADQVATAMERIRAEKQLLEAKESLEEKVRQRTAAIKQTVDTLQEEVGLRIRAEQTIRAERKRFEDVLEMMPSYAILLTPDYHITYANGTFRKWFGDHNGKKCYESLFGRTEHCENCQTYNVMKTGQSQFWEWTGPNGRNYDIYDYPFTDTDGSSLIMEIGVDVTAHKQAQEVIRQNQQALRELTAQLQLAEERERRQIAYDLHDSVGQILAFSSMELDNVRRSLPEQAAHSLKLVSEQLREAINQVRTLSFDLSPDALYKLGFEAAVKDLLKNPGGG